MKQTYLLLVAALFSLGMTAFLAATHFLEPPKKQPVFAPKRIERVLPHLAP